MLQKPEASSAAQIPEHWHGVSCSQQCDQEKGIPKTSIQAKIQVRIADRANNIRLQREIKTKGSIADLKKPRKPLLPRRDCLELVKSNGYSIFMHNHTDDARTGEQDHQLLLKLCFNLCSTQRREGSWDAFTLRPGGSSHWTTGAALAALGKADLVLRQKPLWIVRSVKRGWDYMEKSANLQPVGFNRLTPCDADSTCWLARAIVYRLANSPSHSDSERLGEWLTICIDYLKSHLDKERNGIRTYLLEDGIMDFVNRQSETSSWLNVHSCVTANAKSLGHELRMLLPQFAPQASMLFSCLEVGDQPFWWTAPEILGELNGDDSDRLLGQKRTAWVLRIPFHDDFTGGSSDYSHEADTEGALCADSGAFSLALGILACS